MAAIESNNATMNPSLHLMEDEIVGLEMKLWTQCSNRLGFRNPNDERSRKLLRVDSLAWQLAEAQGTSDWESATTRRLIEFGSPPDAGRQLAAELNWLAAQGGKFVAVRRVRPLAVTR